MKPLAIELNDRSVSLAREGAVLVCAPSAIFDGTGSEPPGSNAWHALRRSPTSISTRHLSQVTGQPEASARSAALLSAELSQHLKAFPAAEGERAWIVAPVHSHAEGLGSVLGIAQSLGLAVDGFIDAAAATVSAVKPARSAAVVLELGLHHAAAAAVDSSGQARRRRAIVSEQGGLVELYQAWLAFISTAMVKRTRFDPFSNAVTEQQLFDALPVLTRQAAETGSTTAAVSNGEAHFEVSLTRDQFAESVQPIYRELVRLLHALRPAGAEVSLVVPEAVALFPGFRELLQQFIGCELITVGEGFAAAATSLLDLPQAESGAPVRLIRRLPLREQPELEASIVREILGRGGRESPPSHLLFDGRAIPLNASALVVGRSPGEGQALALPDGLVPAIESDRTADSAAPLVPPTPML